MSEITWYLPYGLHFNMEHKLWAIAFILALLKTRLYFFHGEIDGDGLLGSQEGNHLNFTSSIKFTMESHPPVCVSGNSSPRDTTKILLSMVHICIFCYLHLISRK